MKTFSIVLVVILTALISCHKKTENSDCVAVTVTQSGAACSGWGIKVNNITYSSANIPSGFQQEGLRVCANYTLYEDMRLCACCGGTWATINSMSLFVR